MNLKTGNFTILPYEVGRLKSYLQSAVKEFEASESLSKEDFVRFLTDLLSSCPMFQADQDDVIVMKYYKGE